MRIARRSRKGRKDAPVTTLEKERPGRRTGRAGERPSTALTREFYTEAISTKERFTDILLSGTKKISQKRKREKLIGEKGGRNGSSAGVRKVGKKTFVAAYSGT